jgi:hypothetical protein
MLKNIISYFSIKIKIIKISKKTRKIKILKTKKKEIKKEK